MFYTSRYTKKALMATIGPIRHAHIYRNAVQQKILSQDGDITPYNTQTMPLPLLVGEGASPHELRIMLVPGYETLIHWL